MKFFLIFVLIAGAKGITINCDFKPETYTFLGVKYTCEVTAIDYSDNSTHITNITGTHLTGNDNQNVAMIYSTLSQLSVIPKGLLDVFPNFVGIRLENSSIEVLNGDELNEYPDLQWWLLSFTNLVRIPGNFFTSKSKLLYVSFKDNKITRVGEGLLENLVALQLVDFENNECISQKASLRAQTPDLIAALKEQCEDVDPTTTTTTTTTTTDVPTTTTSTTTTTTTTEIPTTTTSTVKPPVTTAPSTSSRTLNHFSEILILICLIFGFFKFF